MEVGSWATNIPRYQLRREVMTKKRIAWLDPCFSTVAVRPWYVPFSPGGRQAWRSHSGSSTQERWGGGQAAQTASGLAEPSLTLLEEDG